MSHHPDAVNLAGYSVLGATTLTSGLMAVADIPPAVSSAAGNNAITVAVLTIVTILVNGILADRKSRREKEERLDLAVAMSSDDSRRQFDQFRAESEAKIAALRTQLAVAQKVADENADLRHEKMDRLFTMINGLYLHAQLNSDAINGLIPAVQESAARTGSPAPAVEPVESPMARRPAQPS